MTLEAQNSTSTVSYLLDTVFHYTEQARDHVHAAGVAPIFNGFSSIVLETFVSKEKIRLACVCGSVALGCFSGIQLWESMRKAVHDMKCRAFGHFVLSAAVGFSACLLTNNAEGLVAVANGFAIGIFLSFLNQYPGILRFVFGDHIDFVNYPLIFRPVEGEEAQKQTNPVMGPSQPAKPTETPVQMKSKGDFVALKRSSEETQSNG